METFLYKRIKLFKCSFILLLLLTYFGVKARDNEQRTPSTITNVTVFLNQAQVTRLAKVNLQAGVTNIVFDKVSPYINLNSIQVKTDANITLLSVSQRNNFLSNNDKPDVVVALEDSLNALKYQIALLRIKKEALQLEKDVIIANKSIGGENTGVKIEDLEDALLLFRKRYQEIGEEVLKLENSEKKLTLIEQKLQAQIDQYNNGEYDGIEVVVTVKTLQAVTNAKVEWSYLVGNTSWTPFYDIRVKDTKSPLQLVSKAYISQATGEDWKNVILKLSTTNPNEGGTKPELTTNYLNFSIPVPTFLNQKNQTPNIRGARAEGTADYVDGVRTEGKPLNYSTGIATSQQAAVNIEFNVTSAYTIPSDNTPHQVDLTTTSLPAEYAYGSVPKLDKDAFVTAKVSGNDLVNQVSGEANVYYDGGFIGKTFINGTTSDSVLLSLGRDKRIQIQRTQLKDFSSKSFTGGNRKELNTWEISVRNTRKEPIILVIEDQIPVSSDKEIEVKLLQQGGAEFDEATGKLTWKITLEGEKSTSLRFSFEVKYPKEKQLKDY